MTHLYISNDFAILAMAASLPLVQVVKAVQTAVHVPCKSP